jgi:hypothetical protein
VALVLHLKKALIIVATHLINENPGVLLRLVTLFHHLWWV